MARRMGPFASPGRFASRGLFYSRELRPGVHVVAKWPAKPTGEPSQLQLKYRELMADVQRWAKYRIGPEQVAAKAVSAGSPYLPKDCLIASAWGTMIAVSIHGGGIVTGVRVLASEIQSMLNTITTAPGSMLFRTSTGWRPLYPVRAGYVLTDSGPGVGPTWQPATGGGGSAGAWYTWGWTGAAGEVSVAAGCIATPFDDMKLSAIVINLQNHVDRSLRPGVAMISDGTITGVAGVGQYVEVAAGQTGVKVFKVTPPVALEAGTEYFFYMEADQSGGAVTATNSYSNSVSGYGPMETPPWYTYTTSPPAEGVSLITTRQGAFIQGWQFS